MQTLDKPPRKKRGQPEGPANPKDIRPDNREQPAAAERTDTDQKNDQEKREAPDADAASRQPITNQDEQDRVTNAGQDRPVPEK